MAHDVIVAGGGIIGLSLALELQDRGAKVLVLERDEPGSEASSAAAGMLAASDPATPAALQPFARASAHLWPEYARKLESLSGASIDFRSHGSIVLMPEQPAPPEHSRLSPAETRKLEPGLQCGGYAAFFLKESTVDPQLMMKAALKAALHAGVEVRSHTAVQEIRRVGDSIEVGVQGGSFQAKAAVNCRGAWAGSPVRPRKGQMLYLQPSKPDLLIHVIHAPEVYLVPRSSGKIMVGATVEDVGYDKRVDPEVIETLRRAALKLVPELTSAPVVASWAGLRPGSPDDLPILGETGVAGVFIAAGHFRNGILLAPVTAQVMADLVEGKRPALDLGPFSPARFAGVASA